MQLPVQRAHQHIALGAVVEDHAQARVPTPPMVREDLVLLGDICHLPIEDEMPSWLDFGLALQLARLAQCGVEVLLELFEQQLELLEVGAGLRVATACGRLMSSARGTWTSCSISDGASTPSSSANGASSSSSCSTANSVT